MTRLPAPPERTGDILTIDLRGPESHVAAGSVGAVLWRHRVRSDGTWAAIDSVSLGRAVESALSHVVVTPLATTSVTRREHDGEPHGHVAVPVGGPDGSGVDVVVVSFGRNRFLETRVVARLAPKEKLLQLEATSDGGAIATLRRVDGAVVTRRHDSKGAVLESGELLAGVARRRTEAEVASAWLERGVSVCGVEPCSGLATRFHLGPRGAFDEGISERCVHTADPDAWVLVAEEASGTAASARGAAPDIRCEAIEPGDAVTRCHAGGGQLTLGASRLRLVRESGTTIDALVVSCHGGATRESVHTTLLSGFDESTPAVWRRAVTTVGPEAPTVAPVTGEHCGALRIAGEDVRHGAFRVEVPASGCEERVAAGANPGRPGEAVRADGLAPRRGMVAPSRRPGSERCTAAPGGAALCATRLFGEDRPILATAALPARDGSSILAVTVGGRASARADAEGEGAFAFGPPEAFLVRLDAKGRPVGRPAPVPPACEGWTRIAPERVAAMCERGLLLFELGDGEAREVARWAIDLDDGPAPVWRCGAPGARELAADALPCPHLVPMDDGADGQRIVLTAAASRADGESHLHAGQLRLDAPRTPRASLTRVTTYRNSPVDGAGAARSGALRLSVHRADGATWVLARWLDDGGLAQGESFLTRIADAGEARQPVQHHVLRGPRASAPVVPLGFGTVGTGADGRPVAGIIGLQLDTAQGFDDEPASAPAAPRADADSFVVMPLPGPTAGETARWAPPAGPSPLAALVRAPGVGLPASALLRHGPRLFDHDGDGLTDLLLDVAPDARIPLSARRAMIAIGRGDGGFHAPVPAPAATQLGLWPSAGLHGSAAVMATAFHAFTLAEDAEEADAPRIARR